jgi:hypothetical protein
LLGKKSLRINQLDIKDEDLCLRIGTKENWRKKKLLWVEINDSSAS